MKRFGFTLLAASLALASACKKGGGTSDAVAKMTAFKDRMCACKDKACTDEVTAEMARWGSEQKAGEPGKVSEADQQKLTAVSEEMSRCMAKIMADAAGSAAVGSAAEGSAAGSAAEGSAAGADSGSVAMGAGSGTASETMAHRAGMCPSTVLGATTTSAVKGKSVVVTVESADRDAIAAIQKRADELLAGKKDAPSGGGGGGHDMKGTHGGSQGLCPVYVPEGATATAKRQAKGVVITVTPKDKVDELGTEIAARIPKAAEWVKANLQAGDKGNQGGVGGGMGADGSNHSGKGDGKGQERKKGDGGGAGTGGGGGKGTGGGGGAGTGGGGGAGTGSGGGSGTGR